MTALKPENDKDLLKELESIENLCTKVLQYLFSLDMANRARVNISSRIVSIGERAKNCQQYVKSKPLGVK